MLCTVCGVEVALGDELMPTGPVHAACQPIDKPADPPEDTLGLETFPSEVFGPLQFRPPKGARQFSIAIEEWFYLGALVVATPFEINLPAIFVARMCSRPAYDVRFVVVLSWHSRDEQAVPWRDVGASFSISEGFGGDRAAALQAAKGTAMSEAKRLKAVGPFGFLAAREIIHR